jgi:hypothetical protein
MSNYFREERCIKYIENYASKGLRSIAIAFKDISPGECGVNHDEPV